MNRINIVHVSKKKIRWKRLHLSKILEKVEFYNQLLVVAPPVVTMDNPFMLFWFSLRNLCVILLMLTRSKIVRSEID